MAILLALGLAFAPAQEAPRPDSHTYHGVTVTDQFAWLTETHSPVVTHWVKRQNRRTQYYFERLPALPAIRQRLDNLAADAGPWIEKLNHQHGTTVAVVDRDLEVLRSWDNAEKAVVLVEAESVVPGHEAQVTLVALSDDGRRVAVGIAIDGTEEGELLIFDTADGKQHLERLKQVFGPQGGAVAWLPDASGFYYTRSPDAVPGDRPTPKRFARQELWFHRLGTPTSADEYIFGRDLQPFTGLSPIVSRDGHFLMIAASYGWSSDSTEWYLRGADGAIKCIARRADRWLLADFGPGATLLVQSCAGSPRGRLEIRPMNDPKQELAHVIVPECDAVQADFVKGDSRVFVTDRLAGHERLRVFDFAGHEEPAVPVPPFTSIEELTQTTGDEIVFRTQGYLTRPAWFRYDAGSRALTRLGLGGEGKCDLDDAEVVTEQAKASDVERIPLTIIRKKGTPLDGERPTLLTGYGGFREIARPGYHSERRVWLDHGGVWAIARSRGEGEKGDPWYEAGAGIHKHRAVDDLVACAEHLIARKYTRPGRLAGTGGSNGGLLVGGAITRRPDLFAAAVIDCGVLDLLRLERDANGGCYVPEYGSTADAAQFQAMYDLSPYHRIKEGVKYPAVWLRVGMNDTRLCPAHSYTFAARLQALRPIKALKNGEEIQVAAAAVLLSGYPDEGHEFEPDAAEFLAFLFAVLEIDFKR